MINQSPITVLGFYGATMDAGAGPRRWERWRPTVSLFQREDLVIDRLELIVPASHRAGATTAIEDIRVLSPETTVVVHEMAFRDAWDLGEVYETLLAFVRGYPFVPEERQYWVHLTTGTHIAQICWFLLLEARFVPGRLVQTGPPTDDEPGCRFQVIDLDLARYDRIAQRFAREQTEATVLLKAGIATRNAVFNAMIERIEQVATASVAPILLTGPTGAGKSHLARRIYELKRARRQLEGPLVEVNCATLRGDQAMPTLFGHRKGSFTGAIADRPGLLATADGGLLFLDEIGELGTDEQAMLLRALEDGRFLPVGADREVKSSFQLIAGTNRDLLPPAFRDDLLARIDLWSFRLPGLAERREDIEPNLDHELESFARASGRAVAFNREARDAFLAFALAPANQWHGNFRALHAAVVRMATLAPGGRIGRREVDEEIRRSTRSPPLDVVDEVLPGASLDRFDRVQLAEVIATCRRCASISQAGRSLFAVSRAERTSVNDADRLRKYLARFDLTFEELRT